MNDSNDITLNLIEQYTAMFNKESEAITDSWSENDYKLKSDDTPDMRQFSGDEELKSSVKQEIIDKKAFDKYLADTTKIENEINEIRLANSREYAKELGRIAIDDGNLRKNLEKELFSQQLDDAKSIYSLQTMQDDDRYNELLQQEIELYNQTKVLNPDGSTNDLDINRLKEIQQERSKIERDHIREQRLLNDENYDELSLLEDQLGEKKLGYQREIRKYLSQNGVLQHEAEKKFQQGKINDLKNAYKLSRIQDNDRYDELLQHEAEIYETALKNNAELTKEELKTLKKIQKERTKIEQEFDNDNEKRGSKSLKKLGGIKGAIKKLTDEVFSFINRDIDRFYTDNIKGAIKEYNDFYETNFTEIAGRTGLADRKETHEIIRSTALTVSADETLKKGLNINKDVLPELTNAVKQGFIGEDATAIAISNAVDKKIMPWLETSSETWSQMQFNISADNLKTIKGQQLLLQESREGNRLIQTGIVNTLLEQFQPLLSSIDLNTTSTEDLGEFYEVAAAQMGDNATPAQIKEYAKSLYDAVYKPYDVLQNGSVRDKMLALNYQETGDITTAVGKTGDTLQEMTSGFNNNAFMYGAFNSVMGTNMAVHNKGGFDQINLTSDELKKYNLNIETMSKEDLQELYTEHASKLDEYVTATQEHDNEVQNETVEQIVNAPLMAHGLDRLEDIVGKLNELKTWLIANVGAELVGGLLDKGWDKLTNKLGQKFFGKSGKTGTTLLDKADDVMPKSGKAGTTLLDKADDVMPKSGKTSGLGKLGSELATPGSKAGGTLIKGTSVVGGIAGAYMGIKETYDESTQFTDNMLEGKQSVANTEAYKAFEESLADKHRAKMTGAIAGGVVGGTAGAVGGMAAGAAVGAAVGTVVPVIGNAVGAVVGGAIGLIGGLMGAKLGAAIGDAVSPMENVLSQAAVDSLGNLQIMQTNWDQEIRERQHLVETMRDNTDIEVQKRLLLDAGIDENLVKMANSDEALDKLAETALQAAEAQGKLANEVSGVALEGNNESIEHAFKDQLYHQIAGNDSEGRRKALKELLDTSGIKGSERESILEDIDDSWWGGTSDNDVKEIMARIQANIDEEHMKAIAGTYNLDYDPINMEYLNELTTAITNKDKEGADKAIKLLKADRLNQGGTSWDVIKKDEGMIQQLKDIGVDITQYKLGSTYIPEDMTAQLHKGERVLTADQNKIYTEESISGNKSIDIIKLSAKDIIKSIENQTREIVAAIASINAGNNIPSGSSLQVLPSMGNTRYV